MPDALPTARRGLRSCLRSRRSGLLRSLLSGLRLLLGELLLEAAEKAHSESDLIGHRELLGHGRSGGERGRGDRGISSHCMRVLSVCVVLVAWGVPSHAPGSGFNFF